MGTLTVRLSKHGAECIHNTEWAELSHASSWDLWSASCDWLSDGEPAFSAIKLSKNGLARIFGRKHQKNGDFATIRVYVLPDDVGRRYFDRRAWKGTSNLRSHLEYLIHGLDISSESWEGHNCIADEMKHYGIGAKEDDSLFYLFNTLPSPKTGDAPVACPVSSDAIQSVLASDQQPGLKTTLYPYQKRTVAKMIRREVEPERALDPRFQPLKGPTGQTFFHDNVTAILLRDRREYEEVRGGILGESMVSPLHGQL